MIVVDSLQKSYENDVGILRDISFTVERGEIYTLLGPSGCGKTTSLRSVAGLETPQSGRITLNGHIVFSADQRINLPPDVRNIGMVFQSYAVWPHMTVAENVAYPLKARGIVGAEARRRVNEILEVVGLSQFRDRPSPNLSGGQQQRVALARAIVGQPEVRLLDEPLSNLDAKLREQMRRDLKALQRQLGHTILYVTHDQDEALSLSSRIALMKDGKILEEGEPQRMFNQPKHPFTASFLGAANFVACESPNGAASGEQAQIDTPLGRLSGTVQKVAGSPNQIFFRPFHARLSAGDEDPRGANRGQGTVIDVAFLGEFFEVLVGKGDQKIRITVDPECAPQIGETVSFTVDPRRAIIFAG